MHPVLLSLGPLKLYSYGAMIALGGIASCLFWRSRERQMGLRKDEDFWLLVNVILIGGFAGGRLMFLLEYTRPFSAEFWESAFSLSKGFSVLGAFAGVTGGVWWFARRAGVPLLRLLDYVCVAAPLWHAFGRMGCFLAGCCFGRPASRWGVRFTDPRSLIDADLLGVPVHAAQLYEAFGDLLLFAYLFFKVLPAVERGGKPVGAVAGRYFLGYALIRFACEFFRGDIIMGPLGLTTAQWIAVAMAAAGAAVLVRTRGGASSIPS